MGEEGQRRLLGYRGFAAVDTEDGYAEAIHTTPANTAEVSAFETILDEVPAAACEAVFADKGFHSAANRELLRQKGIRDGLQYRAARNRPLQSWQKMINRLIIFCQLCRGRLRAARYWRPSRMPFCLSSSRLAAE